ncbi:hypothetical protein Acr_23g0010430 [Actinidia rufa]|uniref:Uncharacterized protein n=1 Tax=Actinidia rufa TaxID=165716 RepID=A0A7J0GPI4_9ERIC|nr:hypothetical protein Acr_23g0010430 [Actinidia rufa]
MEKNFHTWSHSFQFYLGGKRKTRWILGKELKSTKSDPQFDEWDADNCIILGWMINLVEDQVYHMFMYHDTVHGLWTALNQEYAHARNESRIFELYQDISPASQPTLGSSVADYFAYLHTRWEELAQYEPLSDFSNDGVVESKRLDRRHTYQRLPPHCRKPCHLIDRCFDLYPELKQQLTQNRGGSRKGGRGCGHGTPRIGAVAEVEPMHYELPNLNQLQTQIAQLLSQLGLALSSSSGPIVAIAAGTPTTLYGPDFEEDFWQGDMSVMDYTTLGIRQHLVLCPLVFEPSLHQS